MQRFYRFGDGYRPSMSWDEKTFAALIDFSKRDEDVRHLLETVFLVTSESEDQLERSCQEIGANRLAADRALYRRLNESDAKLTQVAPLLLPLYGTNGTNVTEATRRLMSDIENELRGENVNFGIDPGVLLNSEFTCLAVIFDQFDPIAHRVKYTIRQEFDEMLQPSGRSWFMDLGSEHSPISQRVNCARANSYAEISYTHTHTHTHAHTHTHSVCVYIYNKSRDERQLCF